MHLFIHYYISFFFSANFCPCCLPAFFYLSGWERLLAAAWATNSRAAKEQQEGPGKSMQDTVFLQKVEIQEVRNERASQIIGRRSKRAQPKRRSRRNSTSVLAFGGRRIYRFPRWSEGGLGKQNKTMRRLRPILLKCPTGMNDIVSSSTITVIGSSSSTGTSSSTWDS